MTEQERPDKSGPLTGADLALLGYQDVESTPDEELRKIGMSPRAGCKVFSALASAGIGESIHAFVYLQSTVREQDVADLQKAFSNGMLEQVLGANDYYVIAPSSIVNRPMLRDLKRNFGERIRSYEDLMWKKIRSEVSDYMQGLKRKIEHLQAGVIYVEPSFEDMNDHPSRYLLSFLSGRDKEKSGLAVVRGEAAFGKTTLARRAVHDLVQKWEELRVVPILLERQTWSILLERSREQQVTNLWDIVSLALEGDLQGSASGILLNREDLFRRVLKLGYAALVFDGFDELRKVGGAAAISPKDNFEWLSDIAAQSNARILVTTRPSFWDREMSDTVESSVHVWNLVSFSKKRAHKYLDLFFQNKDHAKKKVALAKSMYADLERIVNVSNSSQEFINLPVCVDMIAEHVEKGNTELPIEEGQHPVQRFLMAILNREKRRQQVDIDINTLYEAFEEIATVEADGFPLDDLRYTEAFGKEEDVISEEEILKMQDHAFLVDSRAGIHGMYSFKGEFLANHLKGSYLHRLLMDSSAEPRIIKSIEGDSAVRDCIEQEAGGDGLLTDYVASFLELADLSRLQKINRFCGNEKRLMHLKSFLFHTVATTVSRRCTGKLSNKECGDQTLVELGGDLEKRLVSGIVIRGTVADVSLDDWTITDSHFIDLNLVKDSKNGLRFRQCQFEGELRLKGRHKFEDYIADEQSQLVISRLNNEELTDEHIRRCLETVMKKLWQRQLRPVHVDNWKKGAIGQVEELFQLKDLLVRHGFASLNRNKYIVIDDSESIASLRDLIENNRLSGRLKDVYESMKKKTKKH